MGLHITMGAATSLPWVPLAQIVVTAVSACTALAAATIAARAYGAGRADQKAAEIDEVTVGIVDAWKAEKAMERAGQAFDPDLTGLERSRLRKSALDEMSNVTHRSIWPAEIDFAVIEARRLIEDTDERMGEAELNAARGRIARLRGNVVIGVQSLQVLSDSLGEALGATKGGDRKSLERKVLTARLARGNVAAQMGGRLKNFDQLKDLCRRERGVNFEAKDWP